MRLFIPLMLTAFLQLFAVEIANAQKQSITLSFKEAPLDMVLSEIREQTGYNLLYSIEWLEIAKPVTVNVKDVTILEALDSCFAGQPFTYALSGFIITIVPKDHFQTLPWLNKNLIEVSGKVTTTDGNPLPGAYIIVKGANKGTITDEKGAFELKNLDKNSLLQVSYIEYTPQVIRINKTTNLHIRLEQSQMSLDAAVTRGQITMIRRNSLSPVTKITSKDISIQPTNNMLASLQGRGVSVEVGQQSGLPASGFNILIRGQRSLGINASSPSYNSPLFIIDGVPFLTGSETLSQTSFITANTPFSTINPDDVESIEILRDVNATSIYGSQGANGVILITTRKPQPGKTIVDVKLRSGWQNLTRTSDYMNTKQYLEMRREAFANDGATPSINNARDLLQWDTTRNTDFKKLLIGNTARYYSANIRLTGGTEQTSFSFSAGYNRETTVFPGDFHKTLLSASFRFNHVSYNKRLELLFAASYGDDRSKLPRTDLVKELDFAVPNSPVSFDSLNKLVFRRDGAPFFNPYVPLFQPYNTTTARLTGSIKFSYKILPSLQFKSTVGYNNITVTEYLAIPIASQDPVLNPTGSANFGRSSARNWIAEPQLEYSKGINEKSRLKLLAGLSLREQKTNKQLDKATGYTNDHNILLPENAADIESINDNKLFRVSSAYSFINYNYDGRYLLEATGRIDGSSRLGIDQRLGKFYSFAAGWVFSKTKLIQKSMPVVSFGKLRISHGTTGINPPTDYLSFDSWVATQYPYSVPGNTPVRTYNNNLGFEIYRSTDIGVDLGFLNDRILLMATWNRSKTTDQIITVPMPSQTGFTSMIKNSTAAVGNKNFEFELYSINLRRSNLKWITSANVTIGTNKLLYFPDLSTTDYNRLYSIGLPLSLIKGYRTDGVDPATGVYRILDRNGDVIPIPTRMPTDSDLVDIGSYSPSYHGGLQNSIELGNWKLDVLFQFVKQETTNHFIIQSRYAGLPQLNQPMAVLNRWQKPGDNAPFRRYTQDPSSPAYIASIFYARSQALITDASFIRLKTLSLAYSLPAKWIKRLKLNSCIFSFQAQNLLTITSYKGGHDPETSRGISQLPPLRMIGFCVQASF